MSLDKHSMRAGFARADITPPIGSRLHGFHARDCDHGAEKVLDPLYARVLWLEQGNERILIAGFDLLFFDRAEDNRLRGAISREFGLTSREILTNCSHTHSGPMTHTWASGMYTPIDRLYTDMLIKRVVRAAAQARDTAVPVRLRVGETHTDLPISRRLKDPSGQIRFAPNPQGAVYDKMPVCLIESVEGGPVCLVFSVSCHPSSIAGFGISADYPGAAMGILDEYLAAECSLFLQGVGGDAKPSTLVEDGRFKCSPEGAQAAGELAAREVISLLDTGLDLTQPALASASCEINCELAPLPDRATLEKWARTEDKHDLRRDCAKLTLAKLDGGDELEPAVPITAHGVRLADGVRMVGLEGEAVADLGHVIRDFFGSGFTFPLGYTDGCQLYLPSQRLLDEGGYEATSHCEYGWPAPFARGIEGPLINALKLLRSQGIE